MKDEAIAIAVALLKLTAQSADVFPPLKIAAGGALHVVQVVQVSVCRGLYSSNLIRSS